MSFPFLYRDLITGTAFQFADISDDDPPSLPIMLFDNECTPGHER